MSRQRMLCVKWIAVLLLTTGGTAGRSLQIFQTQRQPNGDSSRPNGAPARNEDPFAGKVAEQQARSRNTDRQKKLVSDTDKLLSLATELKQEVDKTDKNTLSVDVVKKADEIERLAHSVKEKMKGGA